MGRRPDSPGAQCSGHKVAEYGPTEKQDSSAIGNTLPHPRPVDRYVVPLRYGAK